MRHDARHDSGYLPYLFAKPDLVEKWHTIIRGLGSAVRVQGLEERPSSARFARSFRPADERSCVTKMSWLAGASSGFSEPLTQPCQFLFGRQARLAFFVQALFELTEFALHFSR